MPPNEKKSSIDELNDSLYSRTSPDVRTRRKLRFSDTEQTIKTSWNEGQTIAEDPQLNKQYEDHSMYFFTKILIASIVFCLGAVGIGAYLFFNGANLISANNIDITINGPVSIQGGEPISFDVVTTNNNNVDLQLVDMSVDFPPGTTDPSDSTSIMQNYRKLIGDIPSGGKSDEQVKAIIFGQENDQKQITVTLTYSVKGSTSVFTKIQTYNVLISSSPINVNVSSVKEITSGQEFSIKVDLKSNSKEVLKNVLVRGSYPFGFTFDSSDLKPFSDNATWAIGDIPPGAERSFNIKGKLQGEDTDTRVFHFQIGAQSPIDPKGIGTQYAVVAQNVSIQKPFISLSISVDGDNTPNDSVAQFGDQKHVQISWFNNLPNVISNVILTAKLSGSAYDKNLVSPDNGIFKSISDEIVWNQQTNPELAQVAAGAGGIVSFNIVPKDLSTSGHQIVNPSISIQTSVSGDRAQETNVADTLNSVATKNIRISSNIGLSDRVVRTVGPFVNYGPIPPVAESSTTYTIIWTVDNTSSSIGQAQVSASLPPYVSWLGSVSPASENVVYDHNSGVVTWNIGNVGTYTYGSSQRREVAFQVSIVPNLSQVGSIPTLVNPITLTAQDNYTGILLKSSQDAMTTRFSTDPAFSDGNEIVVK